MLGIFGIVISGAMAVTKALAAAKLAIDGLKMIGNAITSIAKALGIINPERDVEEIGDRALQAEEQGIVPEKYENYEAWVQEIERDDWGYDPEKNKDMDPETKVLKGVGVATSVTMEKFPDLPIEEFFTLSGKNDGFFEVGRMEKIGELARNDKDAFGNVVNYMTGKAKELDSINAASDILKEIEQEIDSSISEDMAYHRVASYYPVK